ncbi:hypothetical protein, partial [Xylanibacter caecicola]|uniref:hypothetical protein n=1 Tax=Xylanibacter caecicola TaxID=2736294 RepID=UPI002597FEA8
RSNSSTSFGSDKTNGSYWQWHSNTARGGGFYIDIDKNIGDEYTIGLKFSFEVQSFLYWIEERKFLTNEYLY